MKEFILVDIDQGAGALSILADKRFAVIVEMSLEEWIALAPHPLEKRCTRGRDVVDKQCIMGVGRVAEESRRQVAAADYSDYLYKVNGHLRAHLWETGMLPAPRSVFATIYRVKEEKGFYELYRIFNHDIIQPQYCQVADAVERCGLELKATRLRKGYFLNALNIALRGQSRAHQDKKRMPPINVYRAVEVFREELALLDELNPKPGVFYSGVIAAALIALSLYSTEALAFFDDLAKRGARSVGNPADRIDAVLLDIESLRNQRESWITAQQAYLCCRTLQAFRARHADKLSARGCGSIDSPGELLVHDLIRQVKQKKKIGAEPEL